MVGGVNIHEGVLYILGILGVGLLVGRGICPSTFECLWV